MSRKSLLESTAHGHKWADEIRVPTQNLGRTAGQP
jgi:hypothetical protein